MTTHSTYTDYADTLVADADLPTVPEMIYPTHPSGKTLLALANLHSELRQMRELDADESLLADLGRSGLTKQVKRALANEWLRHRERITDALAALQAALAEEGEVAE